MMDENGSRALESIAVSLKGIDKSLKELVECVQFGPDTNGHGPRFLIDCGG